MEELVKTTSAYKIVCGDVQKNSLSHAYLIVSLDKKSLRQFTKVFAKLILCNENDEAGNLRINSLIDKERLADVSFYPPQNEKLKVAMADEIIAQSIIRPLELNKRMFIICDFDELDKNQNKLLKTLEEPPENVILLLATSKPTSVLPTVLSRVKRLDIPPFSFDAMFEALKDSYEDSEKLKSAILFSEGKLGEVEENYNRGDLKKIKEKAVWAINNLKTSRNVSVIQKELDGVDVKSFISILKVLFGDMLKRKNGQIARLSNENDLIEVENQFLSGALIEIINQLSALEKRQHFNLNQTMAIDKTLFTILEAKYKWQKL